MAKPAFKPEIKYDYYNNPGRYSSNIRSAAQRPINFTRKKKTHPLAWMVNAFLALILFFIVAPNYYDTVTRPIILRQQKYPAVKVDYDLLYRPTSAYLNNTHFMGKNFLNPVFVKIMAEGKEAHGSTPWEGIDANEKLMMAWQKIRKLYPYFSKEMPEPKNKWIDTVHVAIMNGGEVSNVIARHAEAVLDFRLTENSTVENLKRNLDKCMVKGASYKISSESTPVVMDENNPYILDYKHFAEQALGHELEFEHIGGATDSRAFAVRGSVVIMHSGTGEGMHAVGEYVEVDSVEKIADIQIKFLDKLAKDLHK